MIGHAAGDDSRGRIRAPRLRSVALAIVAVITASLLIVVAEPAATPARAATSLEITSVLWNGGPDAAPGNGICADSAGRCTLRAALQEANALGGDVTVTVAAAFAGGTITVPDCATTQHMQTTGVPLTTTAFFAITAPGITLDLKNKISLSSPDCYQTGLYVNGANAIVQNVTSFFTGGPSFVVGASGDGATFANLTLRSVTSYFPEIAVVVASGADNVTVRGSTFSGFWTGGAVGDGTIFVPASASVANLRIIGNTFTNDRTTTLCDATNARGCRRSGVTVGASATVNGLTIQSNDFVDFDNASRAPIPLGATAFALADLDISGNSFTGIRKGTATAGATVSLPLDRALTGTNVIRDNLFVAAATSNYAIYWNGLRTANSVIASNLTISGNHFDAFGTTSAPVIGLTEVGSVTVERNTFGPATVAVTNTTSETANGALLANLATSANRDIRGWYPSGTATVNTTACTLTFTATTVSSGTAPATPARLDVYWSGTTSSGAEVLLGSHTAATYSNQTVTVPYTSNAAGRVRIQTIGAIPVGGTQREASQYSRVLSVPATTCRPAITVDQLASQPDPTSTRDIRFLVLSSSPLAAAGAGSLTPTDFDTSASTAPGVQVTSVTRLSSTRYEVVARANDTGTVVLSVPAGAVADAANAAATNLASTSTDNSVTYQNPLSRTPAALTVYQGAPGDSYTIDRTGGAPPTADLSVAIAEDNAWAAAPASVTLASGVTSAPVLVTAAADLAGANRTTLLTHVVTTADPEYSGLLLPAVTVSARLPFALAPTSGPTAGGQAVAFTVEYLPAAVTAISFGGTAASFTGTGGALTATTPPRPSPSGIDLLVDVSVTYANGTTVVLTGAYTYVPQPALSITKTAYSDAAHTVPISSGADVESGTTVYWLYAVENTGETPLTSVTVTDPELPPAGYPGGVVCSIPTLAIAAVTTCSADAVVGP